MPSRSSFSKLPDSLLSTLRPISGFKKAAIVLGFFAVSAGGCGGCDEAQLVCDDNGVCEVCDAYGCVPADPQPGTGGGGSGGMAGTGGQGTGGAAPSCDATATTCPCDANGACPSGLSCVDGLCIDACEFSYECGPGNVCANGKCAPGCDAQVPCDTGYTCDKGVCVPDPTNPQCDAQTPCPNGELCKNGFCTTTCTDNVDCPMGKICDSTTGICITDPSPHPTCDQTTKCTGPGQQCLADGYCHYPCTSVNTCKTIDSRFVACDQGFCKTAEEVTPECSVDKPCPAGKDCISNHCL